MPVSVILIFMLVYFINYEQVDMDNDSCCADLYIR